MSCQMLRLVEARRDGRLADSEVQSVERHLGTCRACRRLESDLDRLADLGRLSGQLPARTALAHRRARLDVLREVAAPSPQISWRPRGWLVAAAAVAVAATLVVWLTHAPPAARLEAGLGELEVAALEPIEVRITPAPRARYAHQVTLEGQTRVERLRLDEGALLIEVESLRAGERFVVVTSDAEVEVRGTRFSVRAERGALEEVIVHEGVVEVRMADVRHRLNAGEHWGSPVVEAAPPSAPPVASRAKPPSAPKAPDPRDGASEAFATAMSELEAGNYGEAGESLRAFVSDHAADARAEDAAFLVIVAMQRAGRHAAAAAAARHYLERFPSGARRAEATVIARQKESQPE